MADIQKLTYPYFTDGTTPLNASNLNQIVAKINEVIDQVNSGATPTQTVATPTISISGTTATISCSTSGATVYYTTNGNTPTTSSTQYSSPITLSGACTIKAIAVKSGMTNSSVASREYSPSSSYEAETDAILGRYTKSVSTAQKDALNAFVLAIKNAGVYSKIDYLVLPFLAASAAEAMQNALGDTGTLTGASSVTLANNAVKPIIGQELCKISLTFDTADAHLSAYNVDAASPTKWDVALSDGNFSGIGKRINNLRPGMYYTDSNSSQQRYLLPSDGYSGEDATAKTYLIASSKSGNTALCYNGSYISQESTIKANSASTGNLIFGQASGIGGDSPYLDPAESSSSFGGATAFSYGLLSIGKGLTQTECTALNTAVTTLMNVIFS